MARGKGVPKCGEVERAARRHRVAELYIQGWRQMAIAAHLGVNQSVISRDLKTIQEQWQAENTEAIDAMKRLELAKLDRIEREAWQAWERSKEDAVSVKEKQASPGALPETETTTKGQAGDPRFLAEIRGTIDRRCKILGIEAPVKIDSMVSGQVRVIEDADWYGNGAHDLSSQGPATSAGGTAIAGEVQATGVRPALGEDGDGIAGGD